MMITDEVMPTIIGEGELDAATSERIRKLLMSTEMQWQEKKGVALGEIGVSSPEAIALAQKHLLLTVLFLGKAKKYMLISLLIESLKEIKV
jgi:hypothetical protein